MKLRAHHLALAGLVFAFVEPGPAAAAERVYDSEVQRLIESTNRGVANFQKMARSDFKNSKMTWDGNQVDVGAYLDDLQDAGKKLKSRYNSDYAAVPEATDYLRRLRAAQDFAATNPGVSGAKPEWDAVQPVATALASAYGIDFAADPSTWKPSRIPDGPVRASAASIETQTKAVGKSVDEAAKTAGLDSSRRKVLKGQSETAVTAAENLRKAIDGSRPAGSAMQSLSSALSDLNGTLGKEGLSSGLSSAWSNLEDSVTKLSGDLGL